MRAKEKGERGDEPEDEIVDVFVAFVQLLVDGLAPGYLRQWYGGGRLVGVGKDGKPLSEDARPIVCGEAWRRIACKVVLGGCRAELAEDLAPSQVAVGVAAGGETILHSLRQ